MGSYYDDDQQEEQGQSPSLGAGTEIGNQLRQGINAQKAGDVAGAGTAGGAGASGGAAAASGGAAAGAEAGGTAAAEGGGVGAVLSSPPVLIAIGLLLLFFFLGFVIKDWNHIYFQGHLGFEDASEYADVSDSQEDIRATEEVENYYASDYSRYEAALELVQPTLDAYLEEIKDDDDERWEASGHSDDGDYVHLGPVTTNGQSEELFSVESMTYYLTSYILDKGTVAQFQAIENGGDEAVKAIAELETKLFDRELKYHSGWYWTSSEIEEVDDYEDGVKVGFHYEYHNEYMVTAYSGNGQAYQSDGVQWDFVKNDEDLKRIIDLYTEEDKGNTESVKEGLELYHNGDAGDNAGAEEGGEEGSVSFFSRIGAFLSNILQSLWEAFQTQLSSLKVTAPVDKVTTLKYGSSAYAVGSYAGNSAALAAIELCRNCQYVSGGKDPAAGVDCSGLVYVAYNAIGYTDIGLNSVAQREQCIMLNQFWDYDTWFGQRAAGDLVLLSGHVAMYVGTTEMMRGYGVSEGIIAEEGLVDGVEYCIEASKIDADKPGDGVKFSTLESNVTGDARYLGMGRPYESIEANLSADVQSLYTFFISCGMTPVGASGVIGNLLVEDPSLSPLTVSPAGYYGLAQWSPSRKQNLISFCNSNGYDYNSVTGQAEFIIYEMRTGMMDLWNHLLTCENASWAAQDFCVKFERCINGSSPISSGPDCFHSSYLYQGLPGRISNAISVYNQYGHY